MRTFNETLFYRMPESIRAEIMKSINKTQKTPLLSLDEIKDCGVRSMLLSRDPIFTIMVNVYYTDAKQRAAKRKYLPEVLDAWAEKIFNDKPMPYMQLRHDIIAGQRIHIERVFTVEYDIPSIWEAAYGKER